MFYILVALADGQTHGYAIPKDVEQLTDGSVRLSTGTLYGINKRLLADGLIRELTRLRRDVSRVEAAAGSAPWSGSGLPTSRPTFVALSVAQPFRAAIGALRAAIVPFRAAIGAL